jgi:hypothetical protein
LRVDEHLCFGSVKSVANGTVEKGRVEDGKVENCRLMNTFVLVLSRVLLTARWKQQVPSKVHRGCAQRLQI